MQMKTLELLAPARTADIGIAAIDCGADAVYIAGPAFGARQAAGNRIPNVEEREPVVESTLPYASYVYFTTSVPVLSINQHIDERRNMEKWLRGLDGCGKI